MKSFTRALLKDSGCKSLSTWLYTRDWLDWAFDSYFFLKRQISRVQRFFFWGWNLKDSCDFDSHSVYQLLALKYRRIERQMIDGRGIHSPTTLKRLKEIYLLLERLDKGDYITEALAPFEKTWGPMSCSLGRAFDRTHPKYKAWQRAIDHYRYMEKQDHDRVWMLIAKYNGHFWD